jgi:iron complex transport system substrate-binding protein
MATLLRDRRGPSLEKTTSLPPISSSSDVTSSFRSAVTRREFIAILGAAGLLVACGDDPDTDSGSTRAPTSRSIDAANGTIEVPTRPERVVALDGYGLDTLFTVGFDPIGRPNLGEVNEYLHERVTSEMTDVGSAYSLSIEAVAALEPDLILGPSENTDLPVEVLSEAAPVVVAPHDDSGDWRAASEVYADAVGRSDEIAEALAGYDERVASLGDRLEAAAPGTVTIARADPDELRLYGKAYFSGTILEDLGLERPPSQDLVEKEPIYVSYERADLADADVIFLYAFGADKDAKKLQDDLQANPIWRGLPAVKAGAVYELGDHWYGSGPIAAGLALDDVERILLS